MPDTPTTTAPERVPVPLFRLGLGARLIIAQLFVASLLLIVAWLGREQVSLVQDRLLRVYSHQVLPLTRLGEVADLFAIDFVDAVHKVSDGSESPDAAMQVLERAERETNAKMQEADSLMTAPAERRALSQLQPLIAQARQSFNEALALIKLGDQQRLRVWRASQLYSRVDPLTARIHVIVNDDLLSAHNEIVSLETVLHQTVLRASITLAVAALIAVMVGLYVANHFLRSLRCIDEVVTAAAAGDLTRRVQLAGSDELSAMARHVDEMIDVIEHSEDELVQQAAALRRSESEARAASAAKSTFLSNVSHELRTPLNVILGYTELLRHDAGLTPEHERGLLRVHEAGQHLLGLIDDVLGLAKMEAAALNIHAGSFAPSVLLEDVTRMLATRAQAKSLVFTSRIIGEVPLAVSGDRRRLLQVLLNLGGNAVKFTAKGEVTITMHWSDERLGFAVTDTGPGITIEDQLNLFLTFSQGEQGRASGEGTGLGLHISQSLVHLMGGDIHVESTLGNGARFFFEVDAPASSEAPGSSSLRALRRAPAGHGVAPMLVVDDRQTNREVLRTLLERAGFSVIEAENGREALDKAHGVPCSLVWMDLKMPVLDGFEAVRAWRERERSDGGVRTPVVAITASVIDLDVDGAIKLGFDDIIPKPFRSDQVLDLIERFTGLVLEETGFPTGTTSVGAPFDLATLSQADRRRLVECLTVGDVHEASRFVHTLGPDATSLKHDIDSFRADAVLDRLRKLDSETPQPRGG